jgi:hypothetical protein
MAKVTVSSNLSDISFTHKRNFRCMAYYTIKHVLFFCYLVSASLFVRKKEKWAELIGWCRPLDHKFSNVPAGT